jgi:hypothetical protein
VSPAQRRLRAQIAAHTRWAKEADRTLATVKARQAAAARFEKQVDPDGLLDPVERAARARHAQQAHMLQMSLKAIS